MAAAATTQHNTHEKHSTRLAHAQEQKQLGMQCMRESDPCSRSAKNGGVGASSAAASTLEDAAAAVELARAAAAGEGGPARYTQKF